MMLSFVFAGKDSYEDYGIVITRRPSIPSPRRRVTYFNIPGRSGSLKFDENTYEDITITVDCSLKSTNLAPKIDEIKAWLLGADENDLIFSFQPEKKYIAQVVNAIDFRQVYNTLGTSLSFSIVSLLSLRQIKQSLCRYQVPSPSTIQAHCQVNLS